MLKKVVIIIALAATIIFAGSLIIQESRRIGSNQGYEPDQPIAYSHKVHAGDNKISCLYCHTGAEKGRHAGIPSANICMNCHTQIKKDSPEIKKISQAIDQNKLIEWVKVHRLPDFVYFNHSQHVKVGGISCQECHGSVETMTRMRQEKSLTMGWCIDCHRDHGITPPTDHQQLTSTEGALRGRLDPALSHRDFRWSPVEGATRAPTIGGMDCAKCHY